MEKDCLFCKIIRKEIPANILYEDDDVMVILDAYPDCDGHSLVIPKTHYEDVFKTPDEVLNKVYKVGKDTCKKLMEKLDKKSLTFLINYGEAQYVKHLHLHLLPNFKSEAKLTKEEVYEIITKE